MKGYCTLNADEYNVSHGVRQRMYTYKTLSDGNWHFHKTSLPKIEVVTFDKDYSISHYGNVLDSYHVTYSGCTDYCRKLTHMCWHCLTICPIFYGTCWGIPCVCT